MAGWLEKRGIAVLERNLQLTQGEIDILAEEGEELVVVEVRATRSVVDPLLSIGRKKRERLRMLAQAVWLRYPRHRGVRIDVVGVTVNGDRAHLEYHRGAV